MLPMASFRRELLVKEREEAELAHCTFKPHINERRAASASRQRPASTGRVPLHMRVADVLRTKNENLSNACVRMVSEKVDRVLCDRASSC